MKLALTLDCAGDLAAAEKVLNQGVNVNWLHTPPDPQVHKAN